MKTRDENIAEIANIIEKNIGSVSKGMAKYIAMRIADIYEPVKKEPELVHDADGLY